MVSGQADYHYPINITAQDLDYMINRPKYGAAEALNFDDDVDPGEAKLLGSVSGRGVIYGGYIYMWGYFLHDDLYPKLLIDGTQVFYISLTAMDTKGLYSNGSSYLYLLQFDSGGANYTAGFSYGITFESSVFIYLINSQLTDPIHVKMVFIYAII